MSVDSVGSGYVDESDFASHGIAVPVLCFFFQWSLIRNLSAKGLMCGLSDVR